MTAPLAPTRTVSGGEERKNRGMTTLEKDDLFSDEILSLGKQETVVDEIDGNLLGCAILARVIDSAKLSCDDYVAEPILIDVVTAASTCRRRLKLG
jgi:hypothetical protein